MWRRAVVDEDENARWLTPAWNTLPNSPSTVSTAPHLASAGCATPINRASAVTAGHSSTAPAANRL
ncbi:hypothetical protein AB0J71_49065 [Nonomuraea sp. NPDC049637]|uniref:hypothetical protein n=1 Tax=Nonomuraea sp. NPDC049637 TaxID=3154356 RepID=UPI003435657F